MNTTEMSTTAFPCDVVAFDLDGTLIDTAALHVAATQAAGQAIFGAPIAASLVAHSLGHPLPESMAIISDGRGQIDALITAFMGYYAEHEHDGAQCFAETVPTLGTLRAAGVPLALVSNKLRMWGWAEIERLGITPYFASIVFMEDMPQPKPSGWALQPVIATLGVAIERVLLVGDSVADIACATAAGALSAAALWGTHDHTHLLAAKPTYAFATMRDLAALFTS